MSTTQTGQADPSRQLTHPTSAWPTWPPGHTIFREISFTVNPSQFGVWLLVKLELLPFPARAIWSEAVKPPPLGLQTTSTPRELLTGAVKMATENSKVIRSDNTGTKGLLKSRDNLFETKKKIMLSERSQEQKAARFVTPSVQNV